MGTENELEYSHSSKLLGNILKLNSARNIVLTPVVFRETERYCVDANGHSCEISMNKTIHGCTMSILYYHIMCVAYVPSSLPVPTVSVMYSMYNHFSSGFIIILIFIFHTAEFFYERVWKSIGNCSFAHRILSVLKQKLKIFSVPDFFFQIMFHFFH